MMIIMDAMGVETEEAAVRKAGLALTGLESRVRPQLPVTPTWLCMCSTVARRVCKA
jgi:hypothetical protein